MATLRTYSTRVFLITALVLFAAVPAVFLHTSSAHAASPQCPSGQTMLTGYAWAGFQVPGSSYTSGPGWISFSGTTVGGTTYQVCEDNSSGDLSGYAWADPSSASNPGPYYGWVDFTNVSNCPATYNPNPNPNNPSCQPKITAGKFSGWAHFDFASGGTSGTTGWISLAGSNYGVTQGASGWSGYAWGDTAIGWISMSGVVNGTPYGVKLATPPITASCSVSPAIGDSNTQFTWTANNISGGTSSSYNYSWSGSGGLSGSTQSVSETYNVNQPTSENGSVTVTDSQGNSSGPIACTNANGGSSITVYPTPTATLKASKNPITNGQSTTLTWGSTNATSCTSGFSTSNSTSGSAQVTPTPLSSQCTSTSGSTTCSVPYSVTCSNLGGSATANTIVTVIEPNVSITADPGRLSSGSSSNISWTSTNTKSCTVTENSSPFATGTSGNNQSSGPITQQTIFNIVCTTNGSSVSAQTIVNILPIFQQF